MTISKTHSFPTFYACYLLKSVQTLRSYRNYIGSTRNPERRLRQHNGVIKQGARETAAYRPWIMQLLVHGFPSKPAATSFEYAWQNPHKSRYLRDDTGSPVFQKRGTRLEQNILVLQMLIRTHPFSTWPLHVKLFTEEAVQCWDVLTSASPLLPSRASHDACSENVAIRQQQDRQQYDLLFPPGFTCSVELEGVHGTSGLPGSGRQDPISVTDEHFTAPYLAKNTALIASGHASKCSVCGSPIHDFATNHLGTTLCTHTGCTSVSHLTCLAKSWLEIERQPVSPPAPFPSPSSPSHPLHLPASSWSSSKLSPHPPSSPVPSTSPRSPTLSANILSAPIPASSSSNPFNLGKGMLPRGGTCTSCNTYILWGDIVKGCYRRHTGQVDSATLEAEEDLEEEGFLNLDSDLDSSEHLTKELELLTLEGTVSRRGRKARFTSSLPDTSPSARLPERPGRAELDSSSRTSKKRGRPRKEERVAVVLEPGVPKGPGQTRGRPGPSEKLSHTPEPSSLTSAGLRRGPGRPRKQLLTSGPKLPTTRCHGPDEPAGYAGVPNSLPSKSVGMPRRPGRPRKLFPLPVDSPVTSTIESRPQSGPEIGPPPRRRGRPTKTVAEARKPTSTVDAMASPSTKRRPGRPKKVPTEAGAEYTLSTWKDCGDEPLITTSTLPNAGSGGGDLQSLPIVGVAKTRRKRGRPRSGNRSGDGSSGVVDLSIVGLESSPSQTELEVLGKP